MIPSATLGLGDEAIAWGAIDAGIAGAFSYPGTPATEILETVQTDAPDVWAHWSANEKVAYEEALGMSYAGRRSLVSMKHVGLNVAADPFINSAITGVNAGLVLVVADDPGMNSSQNEQDSRFYADFAKVPCLEPGNQQEAYDMTLAAFELSEKFGVPVMIRIVTRLAHCRSNVVRHGARNPFNEPGHLPLPNPNDWTLVPANARRRFHRLLEIQSQIHQELDQKNWNRLHLFGPRGLICAGPGYNFVREALGPDPADSLLRIATYPLPVDLIRQLVDHCEEVLVIEEGFPFIESRLTGIFGVPGKSIRGKLDGTIPLEGELTPEGVAAVLAGSQILHPETDPLVALRPPQLCKGCPHSDSFGALLDAVSEYSDAVLFSDIGCYTLGVMEPFRAVHSCVDMGASIGMAHGASRAGAFPVLCTIGDSTFAHSGMTPLLGAIRTDANITVIILDNATTAMTGAQESLATGEELVEMIKGLGAKDLHVFEPHRKNHAANVSILKNAIAHEGLSVVIARRACIHIKRASAAELPICQAAN